MSGNRAIYINRAPVLTLWAAVVAERLGFRRDEALTLGRAVAGLNAYSKGVSLGLFRPSPKTVKDRRNRLTRGRRLKIDVLRRAVPVVRTRDGLRALSGSRPISPTSVQRYLQGKFGDNLTPHALPCGTLLGRCHRKLWPPMATAFTSNFGRAYRPVSRVGGKRQARSNLDSTPYQNKPITAVKVGAPRPVNSLTKYR